MSLPDWIIRDLLKLLGVALQIAATATVTALVTIKVVNRLKTRSDHADKRIDDAVSEIRALADLASDLWMNDAGSPELSLLETKISTRLRQIEEIRVLASSTAPEMRSDEITRAAAQFGRAITGGDFGVHNRKASADTAKNCQHAANRYIASLRRARFQALM